MKLMSPTLSLAADVVDDLERTRIANENRLRALTTAPDVLDEDGIARGHGLDVNHPAVARLAAIVGTMVELEKQAVKNLEREMKDHALGPWVQQARGVGLKQGARLLAAIGDPYWNDLHDRPARLSELWAYSGYHTVEGIAPRRQRGVRANWNPDAKMRAHLVATSCIKTHGHYRDIYVATREQYADATHAAECVRCGPAGKPAPVGSPISAGHQHARGLRKVAKEVLRDLWVESRRIHLERM